MRRGDIVVCVLSGDYGKPRPAVVVQSDLFNETHASVTVSPITSHLEDAPLFRLEIAPSAQTGLDKVSQIMVDKTMAVSRDKIRQSMGKLGREDMKRLDEALRCWFGLLA